MLAYHEQMGAVAYDLRKDRSKRLTLHECTRSGDELSMDFKTASAARCAFALASEAHATIEASSMPHCRRRSRYGTS